MTDVEHLVDTRKPSGGRPDLANWPNHCAEIDRACIQHAIQNSEPGSLLVEDSKLKMDPNASVCFDNPGCRKNRRREAADLGLDAPMLCSNAVPADKDVLLPLPPLPPQRTSEGPVNAGEVPSQHFHLGPPTIFIQLCL